MSLQSKVNDIELEKGMYSTYITIDVLALVCFKVAPDRSYRSDDFPICIGRRLNVADPYQIKEGFG